MLIIAFQKTRHRSVWDTQLTTNFSMRHRPSESHNFALLEVRQLHLSWRCRLVLMAGLGRRGDLGEELCQLALSRQMTCNASLIRLWCHLTLIKPWRSPKSAGRRRRPATGLLFSNRPIFVTRLLASRDRK